MLLLLPMLSKKNPVRKFTNMSKIKIASTVNSNQYIVVSQIGSFTKQSWGWEGG